MNGSVPGAGDATMDHREPGEIEREIESIREDLDGLIGELDRRRHEAFDWRLQMRRHQRQLWIAAGVVGVTVIGFTVVGRRRRRNGFASGAELLHALRVVAEHPEALTRAVEERRPSSRIVSGTAKVASAALPILARNLLREGTAEATRTRRA